MDDNHNNGSGLNGQGQINPVFDSGQQQVQNQFSQQANLAQGQQFVAGQEPIQSQISGQPMMIQQAAQGDGPKAKNNKKMFLAIGGIVGLAAVAGIVVLVINMIGGGSSVAAEKTLTCKEHVGITGLTADFTYEFRIKDGGVSQFKAIQERDLSDFGQWLSQTGYDSEDEYITASDDEAKAQCNSMAGCTYNSSYDKGKKYKQETTYKGEAIESILGDTGNMSKYTAQEIADKLQGYFGGEDSPLATDTFAGTVTCTQN